MRNKKALFVYSTIVLVVVFYASFFVNINNASAEGIITCGKDKGSMCTLCDIIKTIHTIIDYLMKIAIAIALAVFTAAGIMYIVSAGDSGMTSRAKNAMQNAVIGFVVIFCAFLIIDGIVIPALGAKKDLGISVSSWGSFDCSANKGAGSGGSPN